MNDVDDRALADALVMVAVKLPRVLRALDRAPALTAAEASALAVLVHGGAMSIGELAGHEQVKPPSMTRTVANLELKGLVQRSPSALDGRVWVVGATAAGRKRLREGHRRKLEPLVSWLAGLDPVSRKRLTQALPVLEAMAMLDATPPARSHKRRSGPSR